MPIETNLNVPPYHDDFDESKDYHRVLFKPGVSVQVREINQLQTILQKQVERFGDAIYRHGTIVDGCNFQYYNQYPYVKIKDADTSGRPAIPSDCVGLFAVNSNNLRGFIIDYEDGYETTDPDLKTLYVNYVNSGDSFTATAFSPGEVLTLTDANVSIFSVNVASAGLTFTNNESIVVTPRLVVNVSSGSFTNGEYVSQPTTGANLQIIGIDSSTLSLHGQVILTVRPRNADLANGLVSANAWSTANNDSITNVGGTAVGTVESVIGTGAAGHVITDGSGRVIDVVLTNRGRGYSNTPHVSVRSVGNLTGLNAVDLAARNYYNKLTVSDNVDAIGNGYAFSVTDGVIYQKGHFLRVVPQTVIVDKYSEKPDGVAVGFETTEQIIDHMQDTSLLDNVLGTDNAYAPGADRLKLTPRLRVVETPEVEGTSFFSLVKWSEGNPYRQNQTTAYSALGDELASRTYDHGGHFVTDPFLVTTRSPVNANLEANTISVVVDPGHAYVSGYRVKTDRNYVIDVRKGTDTKVANTQKYSMGYGAWVRVNQLAGTFGFNTGATVKLYSQTKAFLSNTAAVEASNLTPNGTEIGTARVRMLRHEDGFPGDGAATYKMYLFDIRMASGKTFRDVRSIYYDAGTSPGICDVVTQLDATLGANAAVLNEGSESRLLFDVGVDGLKNANNFTYRYRTVDTAVTMANTGLLTKSVAADPNEFFPYSAPLTTEELKDLRVVPTGGDLRAAANITGTVSVNTTSDQAVGTGTTFINDLRNGDFVWVYSNATAFDVKQVRSVVNNTLFIMDSNTAFANATSGVQRMFPNNVPIPLGSRDGLTANVDANSNILTVNLGFSLINSGTVNCAAEFSLDRIGVSAGTKTAARDKMVKLRLSDAVGSNTGPWCLGVPDAFRLKSVYVGDVNVNTSHYSDAVDDFFLEPGHNADYVGLSYLHKKARSNVRITPDDYLLVVFDKFDVSTGTFYSKTSYVPANTAQINDIDSRTLANLGSSIATYEVPEVKTAGGKRYDLLTTFDFRPIAANTVAAGSTYLDAPINPANTLSFGAATERKFPVPGGMLTADVEYYLGRKDSVFLSKDGAIFVLNGVAASNPKERYLPNQPSDTLRLNDVEVPSYPTIPLNPSLAVAEVLKTRLLSPPSRNTTKVASVTLTDNQIDLNQPRVYTHRDVGGLERRIANLEYIATLSSLQTDVNSRVIPSSIDPSLNRFKFGFFVNDFETEVSSDTTNPQYAATVENSRCYPPQYVWDVWTHGEPQSPDYCDWLIVGQDNATYEPPPPPEPEPPEPEEPEEPPVTQPNNQPCVPEYVWANTIVAKAGHLPGYHWTGNYAYHEFTVANVASQITMWFYHYGSPDSIEIYQGETLLTGTRDCIDLTDADKQFLLSNSMPSDWFNETYLPGTGPAIPPWDFAPFETFVGNTHDKESPQVRTVPHSWWVNRSGKIVWTHNPANGNEYTVKSAFGSWSTGWKHAVQYPVMTSIIACDTDPTPAPQPPYEGTPCIGNPGNHKCVGRAGENPNGKGGWGEGDKGMSNGDRTLVEHNRSRTGQRTAPQSYSVSVTGLKPNTKHDFYFENQLNNAKCRPLGKNLGDPLITDKYGTISFTMYSVIERWTEKGHKRMELRGSNSFARWQVKVY